MTKPQRVCRATFMLLLPAVIALSCDSRPVLETVIKPENNSKECGAEVDGMPRPMDTLVMRLMLARGPNCAVCRTPGACELTQSQCTCGGPMPVTINNLLRLAQPARFEDVDPQTTYCLQLATIESGEARTGEPRLCSCKQAWFEPQRFPSWGRICGMTNASAGANLIRPQVDCLTNDRQTPIAGCFGPD
ncbi:MAG: hypothetical protein SF187_06010 [Deltaproteobacteria bacterium]|nr:hypothetical protein [Deltaproteobacteria bacterium]